MKNALVETIRPHVSSIEQRVGYADIWLDNGLNCTLRTLRGRYVLDADGLNESCDDLSRVIRCLKKWNTKELGDVFSKLIHSKLS